MPKGKIYFVELKRENGVVSEIQKHVFEEFEKLGFQVHVIKSVKMIEEFISEATTDD